METIKQKTEKAFDVLKSEFGYKNAMQAPHIMKVVISSGIGSVKDKKKIELIADRLSKITGQKPVRKGAKISIAAFKVREGDPVGMQVTLRGARMYDFLDKLINIALPRTKDFRGISSNGIDEMGNYTLGIKENTIFPESGDEDLKDIFGLAVTVVTNVKDPKETKAFLTHLGFPFKKVETKEARAKVEVKKGGFRKK
ncbi:MAG TPA: 50S ribosomal protein L5 [Parcubacteria group bacterium]|jgi:large subunit ribosomal protein L5|nr:50S ribosomal protein L5 [Parcubacteria group bacterium]